MIIAYIAGGRTGNQLYHFLYLLSYSLEYDIPFKIIAFASCHEFEFKKDPQRSCSYHPLLIPLISKLRHLDDFYPLRMLLRAFRCCYLFKFPQPPRTLTSVFADNKEKLILLGCWPYINKELLKKHRNEARKYVQPRREARERAAEIIHRLKTAANVPVVGVHIRRTDYKEWLEGRYFYELDTYREYMKRVSELLNGRVSFLICSDEHHEESDFAEVPCLALHVSHESFMTDFALLMQSDYTMGPPSTFRMTSSFLGNTPSFRIETPDKPMPSLDSFRVPMMDADDV